MVISQGDVVWVDFPEPSGSGTGFRRPAIIVQCDALNRSNIATTVCVPLTSNLKWAHALGNVALPTRSTGLPKDSVANVSLIIAVNKSSISKTTGSLARSKLNAVLDGINTVLGR